MNSILPEPVSFQFDSLARSDDFYERSLSLLNSYSKGLSVYGISVQVSPSSTTTEQPVCTIHNTTLPSYLFTSVATCQFYRREEGSYSGLILISTNSSIESLSHLHIQYEYKVVNGTIIAESPIYFCLHPSMKSKLVTIPIHMKNTFPIRAVVTHIGIPDSYSALLSISNQPDETRFSMNYNNVKCFANPNSDFTPLFLVFYANRYRTRLYVLSIFS